MIFFLWRYPFHTIFNIRHFRLSSICGRAAKWKFNLASQIEFAPIRTSFHSHFSLLFLYLFTFNAEPIIRLKVMSGKILIEWKHGLCKEVAKTRYMNPDIARSTHIDIANIFFNSEQDDSDEISSEHNSGGKNGPLA